MILLAVLAASLVPAWGRAASGAELAAYPGSSPAPRGKLEDEKNRRVHREAVQLGIVNDSTRASFDLVRLPKPAR